MELYNKILRREAKVGIIGLGYVGLPLAIDVAEVGFTVYGVDTDKAKVAMVNLGQSYIEDVPSEKLSELVSKKKITAFENYKICRDCDVINICVPTPFTKTKDPDISYIIGAGEEISKYLRKEQLIILRSTTFPETTEKILLPILEKTGLKVGVDFYLSFAPERIDPGNKVFTTKNTPVVVGGVTKTCTKLTELFFSQFVEKVVVVSSPKVAEMSKLLENIFRSVNIALVNELALMCERMGNIDVWEVIEAAKTKPFGFMPFYPGPGIGGHCILIDPYYLAWKAREYDFHSNFIELAAQVNENMPFHVLDRLCEILGENGIPLKKAELFIIGAAFKKNVGDTRHSPAIKVMELLHFKVKKINYNDPYVPELKINGKIYRSVKLTATNLARADCVLILTDHDQYDANFILKHSKLILDTRNLIKARGLKKLYTLGRR
ncbi:MAG: nucleotide sugar dehydrogenase [candidate division WOR-3 bacterium]|nr:nucleotide sugar dehydrogenase [candidate division WOR-3 bacterium]MCX7756948.1 nucleotide sugar dehydrogenase [candidate division WOR-3 bacterium]MDW7987720.1 nucleotide sugar dehydrogenase [candidate division WOR-3 bacterium]